MSKRLVLTGMRFGLLIGDEYVGDGRWRFRCDCGGTTVAKGGDVRRGHTQSCGCYYASLHKDRARKHGMSSTTEYYIWGNMVQRCTNPQHPRYSDYGGRGIRVCDRWLTFDNFYLDMGARPSLEHSVDRIDNDGDYSPGNCRWATNTQQARNSRRAKLWGGKSQAEWAAELGISQSTVSRRILAHGTPYGGKQK